VRALRCQTRCPTRQTALVGGRLSLVQTTSQHKILAGSFIPLAFAIMALQATRSVWIYIRLCLLRAGSGQPLRKEQKMVGINGTRRNVFNLCIGEGYV